MVRLLIFWIENDVFCCYLNDNVCELIKSVIIVSVKCECCVDSDYFVMRVMNWKWKKIYIILENV